MMEGMPAGLRRIAGQAAQLLTSHVSFLQGLPFTILICGELCDSDWCIVTIFNHF